ncbi:MAG: magnesium transporter [Candidatus Bathyarchaeia archaeon]
MPLNAKKFSATLRQSLMAYTFNIFGIIAGILVAYNIGIFERIPWAVATYPPILSARGVIGGLFCGRLSTALHLGTIQPRIFGNTKSFYLLAKAIIVITLEASIIMGIIAVTFKSVYNGMSLDDFINIITIIVATMALALVVINPLTLAVSFLSFKHGLDPDIILYPIESTVADLLVTAIYISVLNFFQFYNASSKYFIILVSLISASAAIYLFVRNRSENEFIKTIKESFLTIIFVSFIINVAGAVLNKIDEILRESQELYRSYPIYVVYPALIDTIGDIGATVGSTATTKLALGTLKSSYSSLKNHVAEILGAWTASLILYLVYSVLALLVQRIFNTQNFLRFTLVLFMANIIAASCIVLISYSVAILTYQKGLDPDNFEIPIESSFADSVTTISLLVALVLLAKVGFGG